MVKGERAGAQSVRKGLFAKGLAAASAVALSGLAAVSCAALAGLDGDFHRDDTTSSGTGGSGGSGTTTSTTGGSGTGGEACVLAHVPEPTAGAADGGDLDFVTATRTINLDEKDFDPTIGFDVDNLCSCLDGAPPSCTPVAEEICDGPGGLDNAVGTIFATVYDFSSKLISSGQLSSAANKGVWTMLTRVHGYNGTSDDAAVSVSVYMTQGVGAGMPVPVWDGNDAWPVDDVSLSNPADIDSALVASTEAYVTGGVLVAKMPAGPIHIRGTLFRMDLDLVDVVLQARLEKVGATGYKLADGVISGKWPLSKAFGGIASIRYAGGSKLCKDDDNYESVKLAVCGNADLKLDGTGGTCDTLSFGALFTAEPAKLGAIVPGELPPDDACAADMDPSSDTCN